MGDKFEEDTQLEIYNSVFNWTISYRSDSDFRDPYMNRVYVHERNTAQEMTQEQKEIAESWIAQKTGYYKITAIYGNDQSHLRLDSKT